MQRQMLTSPCQLQESETLTGGNTLNMFTTPFGKIGLGICYDVVCVAAHGASHH